MLTSLLLLHITVLIAVVWMIWRNLRTFLVEMRHCMAKAGHKVEFDFCDALSSVSNTPELAEFSQSLAQMHRILQRRLTRHQAAFSEISHAANELASLAQNGKVGAAQQTKSIETIAASIEQMSASTASVAGHAKDTEIVAGANHQASQQGTKAMHLLQTEMRQATQSVESAAELVNTLGQRSLSVREWVDVINAIADQINLKTQILYTSINEAAQTAEHLSALVTELQS